MKEPKEIYFLPVEQLSDDAIQCIEKVFELLDAIKDDCNINNFSRRFTFIREGKAISDVAEIKKDSDGLNHIYQRKLLPIFMVGLYLSYCLF